MKRLGPLNRCLEVWTDILLANVAGKTGLLNQLCWLIRGSAEDQLPARHFIAEQDFQVASTRFNESTGRQKTLWNAGSAISIDPFHFVAGPVALQKFRVFF